jgi:hypothetical protein
LVIVWPLYYARLNPGNARNFARRIYRKIDENICGCANELVAMKGGVADNRRCLAHPDIPDDTMMKFITSLGSEGADLEAPEIEMFHFLKLNSNTLANIECASGNTK